MGCKENTTTYTRSCQHGFSGLASLMVRVRGAVKQKALHITIRGDGERDIIYIIDYIYTHLAIWSMYDIFINMSHTCNTQFCR